MKKYSNEELVDLIRNSSSVDERKLYLGTLYEQNRRFMYKICQKYSGYEDINDLMQESYFGLCDAVENYDSTNESDFMTYAWYWIRQKVDRYVKDYGSTVRVPVNLQERIYKYNEIIKLYNIEYGRNPSDFEACHEMGISREQLKKMKNAIVVLSVASLDKPVQSEDGEAPLQNFIPDAENRYEDIDDQMDADLLSKVLWEEVDTMDAAEVNVIHKRYQEDKTLRDIGSEIGITAEAVRRLETKALSKLRRSKKLRKYAYDYILYAQAYSGSLRSFRCSGYSITERIAINNYERSQQEYLRRLEQQLLNKEPITS